MRVDCHIHITPKEIIEKPEKLFDREPYFKLLSESKINKFAKYEDVSQYLQQGNFQKGVIFGFAFQDEGLCSYVNEYVGEALKTDNKFIGYLNFPPKSKNLEKEMIKCKEMGLSGVGEIYLDGQGVINYKEDLKNIMNLSREMDMPLLIHSNEPLGHEYCGKTKISVDVIWEIINNYENNKIIWAHLGGGAPLYSLLKEVQEKLKNSYFDTAAMNFIYESKILLILKELGFENKILFGSDFPLLGIERYNKYFNGINIDEEYLNKIMGENFKGAFINERN